MTYSAGEAAYAACGAVLVLNLYLYLVTPGNMLCKYAANDTYLVIPASNTNSRSEEMDSISTEYKLRNLHNVSVRVTRVKLWLRYADIVYAK